MGNCDQAGCGMVRMVSRRLMRHPGMVSTGWIFAAAVGAALLAGPASADTIEAALVRAYQNNPQLNAQRASVRAVDETVPQALSGYRPRVSVTASAGVQYTDTETRTSAQ